MSLRVGIAGVGYWGPHHVRNFNQLDGVRVTVVADRDPQRRAHIAGLYPATRVLDDADVLLAQDDVDAVVVATPAGSHYAIARAALESGRHVLVEKPLTTTVADAEGLVALAESRGLVLASGHTFLYNPAVRKLREILASGELGEVRYVDSVRANLGLHRKDVDVAWDLAAHDISILLYLLGESPAQVTALTGDFNRAGTAELAYLGMRFPGGVVAQVHASWLFPVKVRRMTVVGARRMAVFDDVEPTEKLRIYDRGVDRLPYADTFGDFHLSYRNGEITAPAIDPAEPLRLECEEFVRAIRDRIRPVSDGRLGIEVVRVLDACDRSRRAGGVPVAMRP